MNEHELKSALQDAVVASSPPPPMSPAEAVAAGRAAQRRRKAAWGGGVAGLAVVAIAVGAVLVPQLTGGANTEAGGAPPLTTSAPPAPPSVTGPSVTLTQMPSSVPLDPSQTKPEWPDGQTDRTARSGPRADKSVQALNDLGASLPATFQAVDKTPLTPPGDPGETWYGPMRYTQSQFEDYYDGGKEIWEYLGTTPVTQQGTSGVGKLWIMVLTKGNRFADVDSPCKAAEAAWAIRSGECAVRTVGGKQVGYVTATPTSGGPMDRNDLDEVAIHRHDDGTLVVIGQAKEFYRTGHPALSGQPFTADQLSALVTDPKFHLD
ncbi:MULTISPECIES: hypothetical protein [unclassified Saccharothrix]|uniref:hypothetical protein n=1 Tax=unclassified Saccharothrix TaxID=2593673 RepID=UPI00307DD831